MASPSGRASTSHGIERITRQVRKKIAYEFFDTTPHMVAIRITDERGKVRTFETIRDMATLTEEQESRVVSIGRPTGLREFAVETTSQKFGFLKKIFGKKSTER